MIDIERRTWLIPAARIYVAPFTYILAWLTRLLHQERFDFSLGPG
jgi:hypothetical protein